MVANRFQRLDGLAQVGGTFLDSLFEVNGMLAERPLHIFQLFLNSFPLDNLAREFLSARFDPPALQFHRSNRKSDGQSRKQETTEREKVVSGKVVKIKRISRGNKKPVCRQIGKNRGHD